MRISMVAEHASPLRADDSRCAHVAALSAALSEQGHAVTVFTRRDSADADDEVRTPDGYRVVQIPAGPADRLSEDELLSHTGRFGDGLRMHWLDSRPDVAHAHYWMSGLATELAARNVGLPVVQTFHELGDIHQGPDCRIRMERLIARGATRVAAASSDEAAELARMGVPRSQTTVVPCGVDLDLFCPDGTAPAKTQQFRLVSVGTLLPEKGFDIEIEALATLHDTELVIAGAPEHDSIAADVEAQRLLGLARAHGVADRVHLLGHVRAERMPALLRSADVVVCAPQREQFGRVSVEAMACGKPVVATAVGGMRDTVVDGVTGILVPPGDPTRLADAVRVLLSDIAHRVGAGIAARDRALARYSWERVATDTARVYARANPTAT